MAGVLVSPVRRFPMFSQPRPLLGGDMLKTKILGALSVKGMKPGEIQNRIVGDYCMSEIEPVLEELIDSGQVAPDIDWDGYQVYERVT